MLFDALLAAAPAAPADGPPVLLGLAAFAVVWVAIATALGATAGFPALLSRFPPDASDRVERRFRMASGRFRAVGFGSTLSVGLGRRGLHVAPNAFFRSPFLRGVPCIPWAEVRYVGEGGWWSGGTRFEVPRVGLSFTLSGRAGRAVSERLSPPRGVLDLGR